MIMQYQTKCVCVKRWYSDEQWPNGFDHFIVLWIQFGRIRDNKFYKQTTFILGLTKNKVNVFTDSDPYLNRSSYHAHHNFNHLRSKLYSISMCMRSWAHGAICIRHHNSMLYYIQRMTSNIVHSVRGLAGRQKFDHFRCLASTLLIYCFLLLHWWRFVPLFTTYLVKLPPKRFAFISFILNNWFE